MVKQATFYRPFSAEPQLDEVRTRSFANVKVVRRLAPGRVDIGQKSNKQVVPDVAMQLRGDLKQPIGSETKLGNLLRYHQWTNRHRPR